MFAFDARVTDSKLSVFVFAHCIAQIRCCDKCSVSFTTRNLNNRNVIAAEARKIMRYLAG